jgi:sortase A
MNDWLRWIERALLIAGVSLAVWCAAAIAQAVYFDRLPVPSPVAISRMLPGEEPVADVRPAAAGTWVGRLEAPAAGLSATVLEGSGTATLAKAAGRIEYTALPGETGNLGIAGHRDTVFRPVRRLKVGDTLTLTTAARVFEYQVSKLSIVDPDAVHVLDPTSDPTLTLVTCYPFSYFGSAPKRYIVAAALTGQRLRTH